MPRSRNFDESTVIDAAVDVFWQGGLGTTSIDDLLRATGLSRSSLYNAFGSKDEMLCRIIQRYVDMQIHTLEQAFQEETLRRSLTRLFDVIALDNNGGKGCLLVNGINELHGPETDVLATIRAGFSRIADKLSELVSATDSSVHDGSPEVVSMQILTTIIGLRVLQRSGLPLELVREAGRRFAVSLTPGSDMPTHRRNVLSPEDGPDLSSQQTELTASAAR